MTVDDAVAQAKVELMRLFPGASRDLRLEEAETPLSTGKTWRLTFSMAPPEPTDDNRNSLAALLRSSRPRKVIELEENAGSLVSVKNG